ncbi:hypothetical protein QEZ52_14290 [Aliisedimentitalea scapharcae]|uniref:Type IV pilus biogenesis n=1 Tax=Aliisedimentitalea scapharcae TaxID=1524259 RepID=A0ABZ2XPG8_9RHOB|nr:hypothetical protein K3727_14190 [Rhodobacteraceae bacterium M382]
MTNTSSTGPVAAHATEISVLNRNALNLLGLFGPAQDMRALVRLPGGRVIQVARGSRLSGETVAAIDETGVILQKRGQTRRIAMPSE